MASELFVVMLTRTHAAACVALILVLAARLPFRKLFGAQIAYRIWAIVPAAAIAGLFPSLADFRNFWAPLGSLKRDTGGVLRLLQSNPFFDHQAHLLLAVWALGACGLISLIVAAERRFRERARLGLAGPAIVGVAAPRLVVPYDFDRQFTELERQLIRWHERTHVESGHPTANVIAAVVQVIFWFNPLVPMAISLLHADQELACDATVMEHRPSHRRLYGEILLKASAQSRAAPLGCALSAGSPRVLEIRIRELNRNYIRIQKYLTGFTVVGLTTVVFILIFWLRTPDEGFSRSPVMGESKPISTDSSRTRNIYVRR